MKKNFKKIAAVTLSCVLTLGMSLNAFAADPIPANPDLIDSRAEADIPDTEKTNKNVYPGIDFKNSASKEVSRNVTVTLAEHTRVYRVDVNWDSTNFTYEFNGTWSPENHAYVDADGDEVKGTFKVNNATKDYAAINVTNHSNNEVNVAFSYTSESDANGFTASIKDASSGGSDLSNFDLDTADAGTSLGHFNAAPNDTAYLVVSGTPNDGTKADAVTIGTVKVTIKKK